MSSLRTGSAVSEVWFLPCCVRARPSRCARDVTDKLGSYLSIGSSADGRRRVGVRPKRGGPVGRISRGSSFYGRMLLPGRLFVRHCEMRGNPVELVRLARFMA